jgi:hypothetical protein
MGCGAWAVGLIALLSTTSSAQVSLDSGGGPKCGNGAALIRSHSFNAVCVGGGRCLWLETIPTKLTGLLAENCVSHGDYPAAIAYLSGYSIQSGIVKSGTDAVWQSHDLTLGINSQRVILLPNGEHALEIVFVFERHALANHDIDIDQI